MNLLHRLDDVSPMLCRLLARQRYGKPLTTQAIAAESGIPSPMVEAYSWSASWDGIPIKHAFKFAEACGVSFVSTKSMNRVYNYLNKNPTFQYLRNDPKWKEYYQPLLLGWYSSFGGRHREKGNKIWKPVRALLLRLDVSLQHRVGLNLTN